MEVEENDECYCDFASRRFFGSTETAHDPICPQYEPPLKKLALSEWPAVRNTKERMLWTHRSIKWS